METELTVTSSPKNTPPATPAGKHGLFSRVWEGVWTGTVASVLEGLLKIPRMMVMTRVLGPDWYGLLGMFGMMREVTGRLAQLGTGDAVIRQLAAARAKGDARAMGAVMGAAGLIRTGMLLLLGVGLWVFSDAFIAWCQRYPALSAIPEEFFSVILFLLLAGVGIQMLEGPFGNALQGAQAWRSLLVVRIITALVSTAFPVAAALLGMHLVGIVAAQQLAFGVTAALIMWYYWRLVRPMLRRPTMRESLVAVPPVLMFGLPLILGQLFRFLYTYTDQLMLAGMGKSVEELSFYEVGRNAALLLAFVPTLLRSVLFPAASEYQVGRGREALEALFRFMTKHLCWVMAPCALWMAALAPLVIRVMAGERYLVAAPALCWLGAFMVLNGFGVAVFICLVGAQGRTREQFLIEASGGGLNVAFNYWLIPELGFMGAVYATVSVKAISLALGCWFLGRTMRLRFPAKELGVCLFVSVVLGVVLWGSLLVSSWLVFCLLPLVGVAYLWGTVRFGVLDTQDEQFVRRLCGGILRRLPRVDRFLKRNARPVAGPHRM